jgi:hypothetical protein
VHDLQIHPREHDLIVATHGRGIFITDISALEEMSDKTLGQDFFLFDIESKVKWIVRRPNVSATTNFDGQSEPTGVMVNYYQKAPATGDINVKVLQGSRVVAETKGPNTAGINQLVWNMRMAPITIPGQPVAAPAGRRGGSEGGPPEGFGRGQAAPPYPTFGGSLPADVGEYTVVVTVGGKTFTKKVQIIEDAWFDKMF